MFCFLEWQPFPAMISLLVFLLCKISLSLSIEHKLRLWKNWVCASCVPFNEFFKSSKVHCHCPVGHCPACSGKRCFVTVICLLWKSFSCYIFSVKFTTGLLKNRQRVRSFQNNPFRANRYEKELCCRIVILLWGKVAWDILQRLHAPKGRKPAWASASLQRLWPWPGSTRTFLSERRKGPKVSVSLYGEAHLGMTSIIVLRLNI